MTEFIFAYTENHTPGSTPTPPATPPTDTGGDEQLGFGGAMPAGA